MHAHIAVLLLDDEASYWLNLSCFCLVVCLEKSILLSFYSFPSFGHKILRRPVSRRYLYISAAASSDAPFGHCSRWRFAISQDVHNVSEKELDVYT